MKKLTTLVLAVLFTASLSAQTRTLEDFNEVSVSGSITATLVQSNETKVEIKMIKGDIKDLMTEVDDNDLTIKFKKGLLGWSKKEAEVTVYYRSLNDLDASAGGTIVSKDVISSSSMDIDASSGARISVEVEGSKVELDASSGSSIKVKGNTDSVDADASSGASINAQWLEADHAKADVSSGASISVVAHKSINAEASSGGSIRYKGDPETKDIENSKYSGGSVSKM